MDIKKTLYENLPEYIYHFYDIFRTTSADGNFGKVLDTVGDFNSCIEIGTANGMSALYLAQHSKQMVFTFDTVKRNADYIWSFFPELRKKIYSVVGSQEYIDESIYHVKIESGLKLDMAFIDGNHDMESVQHDYELVTKIAGISRILFHDCHIWEIAQFVKKQGGYLMYDLYGYVEL